LVADFYSCRIYNRLFERDTGGHAHPDRLLGFDYLAGRKTFTTEKIFEGYGSELFQQFN
jgi:hypothetical protein